MIGIGDDLRKAVLQAAIQGKLTEQLKTDGNAEALFAEIQKEKQKLIAEKKIKKEKNLESINLDDVPFDIPDNWKWVKLGEISTYSQKKVKASPNDISPNEWSLDLEDIEKGSGRIINKQLAQNRTIVGDKVRFFKGQVLYSKLRPYLKKILVADGDGVCSSEIVPFNLYGDIDSVYICNLLRSPHVDYTINAVTYGVKMPRVGTETMENLLVPLPPLAEQHRIVAKVDELMAKIDEMEKTEKSLTDLYNSFPSDMKASLLQAAIQGKLTEQLSSDGDAETLYVDIQKERQKLIMEGKFKMEKELKSIDPDDVPFDIPANWKWVRLGSIVTKNIKRGKTPRYSSSGKVLVFAQKCNTKEGFINLSLALRLDDNVLGKYQPEEYMINEDIVINSTGGGTMGRVGIYHLFDNPMDASIVPDGHVTVIRTSQKVFSSYIFYFLKLSQNYLETLGDGTTNQTELKPDVIKNLLIPLPPLVEQKRIVEKLDQLLPICESMKEAIDIKL